MTVEWLQNLGIAVNPHMIVCVFSIPRSCDQRPFFPLEFSVFWRVLLPPVGGGLQDDLRLIWRFRMRMIPVQIPQPRTLYF